MSTRRERKWGVRVNGMSVEEGSCDVALFLICFDLCYWSISCMLNVYSYCTRFCLQLVK